MNRQEISSFLYNPQLLENDLQFRILLIQPYEAIRGQLQTFTFFLLPTIGLSLRRMHQHPHYILHNLKRSLIFIYFLYSVEDIR